MFVIKSDEDPFDRFVSSNVSEDAATEYDPDATYVSGDIRKVSSAGTVYKCIANAVVISGTSYPVKGFSPPDYLVSNDATHPWMELRAINRMAMFDPYINTQTQSDPGIDYIETVLRIGNCDTIAFFNVVASAIEITLFDNQGKELASETQSMYEEVFTLYDYFFSEVSYKRTTMFRFGIGIGGTIRVRIANAGSTAKCGMIVAGRSIYLGSTKDEVEIPITDYSTYKTDALGRVKLEVGFYASLCNFTIYMTESRSSNPFWKIRETLIALRGRVTLWCADNTDELLESNPALVICGYFTDLKPVFRNSLPTFDISLAGVV